MTHWYQVPLFASNSLFRQTRWASRTEEWPHITGNGSIISMVPQLEVQFWKKYLVIKLLTGLYHMKNGMCRQARIYFSPRDKYIIYNLYIIYNTIMLIMVNDWKREKREQYHSSHKVVNWKKPSTQWEWNPGPMNPVACALPLSYNRCPSDEIVNWFKPNEDWHFPQLENDKEKENCQRKTNINASNLLKRCKMQKSTL